jgi:hypothetical protein
VSPWSTAATSPVSPRRTAYRPRVKT